MKCDKCKKPAVVNYQDAIMRFNIAKNGDYDEGELADDFQTGFEMNLHLCETHDRDFQDDPEKYF